MNQKGFANIAVVIGVIIVAGVAGYFILNNRSATPIQTLPIGEQPTSSTSTSTISKTGDIEEIQVLLNKEAWVRVIVMLKGNEFTAPEFISDDAKKTSEVHKIQNAVLATLTKDDFQISHQYQFITSFAGAVSKSGMEKLIRNPLVTSISLDRLSAPN